VRLVARSILGAAFIIGAFSVVAIGLVTLVYRSTEPRIKANERAVLLRTLGELVSADDYDNDLLLDRITVVDADLGTGHPAAVYRARKLGQVVAVILSPIAPDGYSGAIRLLVAVRPNGTLAGVRVIGHKETPGLGDPIEVEKSDWILNFSGRSLQDPAEGRWAVKKDGGDFDQFTGATITPRAVVKAVRRTLVFFETHRSELLSTPAP
jgi:electron transport complex protein RnfG